MYRVTATKFLTFPFFIQEDDYLTIDETMEALDGDLIYMQSSEKTSIGLYTDFMQVKEDVTAHVIVGISRTIKDDEATRQARLKRCGL